MAQMCFDCPPGMVAPAAAAVCIPCPWNTTAVNNSCEACPPGSFTITRPSGTCLSCSDNGAPHEFCPPQIAAPPTTTALSTPASPVVPPVEHTVRYPCLNFGFWNALSFDQPKTSGTSHHPAVRGVGRVFVCKVLPVRQTQHLKI